MQRFSSSEIPKKYWIDTDKQIEITLSLLRQQDTPVPGTYDLKDFVEESHGNPVTTTYGFKNARKEKKCWSI